MMWCVGPLVVDGHDAGLCSVAAALRRLTWLAVEVEVLRRRVARAFSVCKRMPRFWKICDCVEFLISPAMHALTLASSETAAGPQAPPVRLHDHGDEADAGSLAIKLGVVVLPLVVFVLRHGCRGVVYGGVHQIATKA